MKKLAVIISSVLFVLLAIFIILGFGKRQYFQFDLKDVVYKTVGNQNLKLDIYFPQKRIYRKSPVLVFFHGGSWVSGEKELVYEFEPSITALLEKGFIIVSAEYRFADNKNDYKDINSDVCDAVRFLVKNAKNYDLDIENIGTMGFSSGAYLALMAALAPESFKENTPFKNIDYKIKYIIAVSPPTNFNIDTIYENALNQGAVDYTAYIIENFVGGLYNDFKDDYHKASPFTYLDSDNKPKILLVHGNKDQVVDVSNSYLFLDEAIKSNYEIDFIEVENGLHRFFDGYTVINPDIQSVYSMIAEKVINYADK